MAGFLELVRYGVRRADDPLIIDSLKVVDAVLKTDLPQGPGWHRYNFDGYGQRPDGGPFQGWGQGRIWPLFTGERAHYELAAGTDLGPLIATYERFATLGQMMPEQVWDEADRGGLEKGKPAGSAVPLVWAHAEYLKLLRSAVDGKVFDRIDSVYERYCEPEGKKMRRANLEFYSRRRPIQKLTAGDTLRILDDAPFEVLWTTDQWKTDAFDHGPQSWQRGLQRGSFHRFEHGERWSIMDSSLARAESLARVQRGHQHRASERGIIFRSFFRKEQEPSFMATLADLSLDELSIDTLRLLAVDEVQKANSGHPGAPLGCAPIAYLLFHKIMKHNPANSKWPDRDRFVLSNGHASALLYGTLFLSGYKVTIEDLQGFRQWHSRTPGHPEYWRHGWRGSDDRSAGAGIGDGCGNGDCGEASWRHLQQARL